MEDKQSVLLRTTPGSPGESAAPSLGEKKSPSRGRSVRRGPAPPDARIRRPIFIVGIGRSGSTIFHRMFSDHPNVTLVSGLCDRHPSRPALSRALQRMIDWPVLNLPLKRHYEPGECYKFWDHHCNGFAQPFRDLLASDVTELNKARIPPALAELLTPRRQRLLFKITGWPRIGFLHELFPDALFIHIFRDGRAVANSLLEVDFWHGWRGPQGWRWGELDDAQRAEWERHGRSFVALAALQWKLLMDATAQAAARIPSGQFMQLRYEDFVLDPMCHFRDVTQFCGLDWSPRFEKAIGKYKLRSTNDKWRKDLTTDQQAILQSVLGESLATYGYA
jgi:hypothetical protein